MEFPPQFQATQAWTKSQSIRLDLIVSLFLALLLSACGEEGEPVLPAHSGRAGEIIVIMKDSQWEGAAGEAMREILEAPYPMLPQREERFSIMQLNPDDVSYNFRTHRNIIQVDIEDKKENQEEKARQLESKWSSEQTVYSFQALSTEKFIQQFQELGPSVAEDIRQKDMKRIQRYISHVEHPGARKQLREKMQLELRLHREYRIEKIQEDFAWFSRENVQFLSGTAHDVKKGILVYTTPYTSDSLLEPASISQRRDSILSKHVLSTSDSPMIIEQRLPPEYKQVNLSGLYAIEGRGLWKFDSPLMGGPFISLSVVDESRGRIVTVEGYVFAPKFDKRNFLLEVEAIAYSLAF